MNVAFLPVYPNPYQRLLRDALAGEGVAVEFLDGPPSTEWLRAQRGRIDILHYHWLYGLYMARFRTPARVAKFVTHFRQARDLGYRIVWTAHNVLPHRTALQPLHARIRRLMMAEADAVIVHCEAGRRELLFRFPRKGPVHVIPLGNYKGLYPMTVTRPAAREALGLNAAQFVYLSLGNIAAYKGLDRYVELFRRTAAADDIALIAGRNRDAALVRRLERAAAADPRIRLRAEFVPDDAMQHYLLAADVLVAPFDHVLTSSSVMVGLSYGLPVIAPSLGCLPELVTGDAGLVYQAGDPGALGKALSDVKHRDLAAMGAAARRIADRSGWDEIGHLTARVYEACLAS
jgi:glycosyltransferase involved in cell wall biosynthesis